MSEKVVWRAGNSPGEFMSNYRGWILIAQRQTQSGMTWWQWLVQRSGWSTGSVAFDLREAERAAIAAVDQMEVINETKRLSRDHRKGDERTQGHASAPAGR